MRVSLFLSVALGWRDSGTDTPGVYTLQRRYFPGPQLWGWGSRRVSGDDLEHHRLRAMDWGVGVGSSDPHLAHLYIAASGAGAWDGSLVWE